MKINKANDSATTNLVSDIGDGVSNANPITAAIGAVTDIGKAIVDSCTDIAKTAHAAFTQGLATNADLLKANKVNQQKSTGIYIVMGILFVGAILIAALRTPKK
ncbi:MAG: hypothetical protein ACI30A_06640 [Paludibacteraceae bacterium]